MDALRILENIGQEVIVEKWEPLLNNLGHVYRKLRSAKILLIVDIQLWWLNTSFVFKHLKSWMTLCVRNYERSLEFHKRAGILSPQSPSTYSAIGYTYVLMGDNLMAVDYFHKVTVLNPHLNSHCIKLSYKLSLYKTLI